MIKIDFIDFWPDFNKENNYFTRLLRRYLDVEISADPDYIFVSLFGTRFLAYDCIKICFIGENVRPNFDFFDYALGFDWLTFGDRYYRLPLYRYYDTWLTLIAPRHYTPDFIRAKSGFCNFVYSNGERADPCRTNFFHHLSQYKRVDAGGKHLNNIGHLVPNKLDFIKDYKFTIAFENESFPGYTTEKITDAFVAGSIPIYWGNPLIASEFNPDSFINCHNFANFDHVVQYIQEIEHNEDLYLKMLNAPIYTQGIPDYLSDESIAKFLLNIVTPPATQARRKLAKTSFNWNINDIICKSVMKSKLNKTIKKYVDRYVP